MSMNEERAAIDAPGAGAAPAPPASQSAATPRIDGVAVGAAVGILIGWFVLDTVVAEIAGIRLGFHFYDMWSVLAHPSRLFTGLADGDGLRGVLFGTLCLAALASAFVPQNLSASRLRLGAFAPLLLMLLCGALVYEKSSGDFFPQANESSALGAQVLAFANTLAHRLSATVTRHISLGLGAYVAFAASIVLAVRGLPRPRAASRYF